MSVLNAYDKQQIQTLAWDYAANTFVDNTGTDEVGEIHNLSDLRILAHTLQTPSQTNYITDRALTWKRWQEIQMAFGEALMTILNSAEYNSKKDEIASDAHTTADKLSATNITACIQASEHGILDSADQKVLFALWHHDINSDFLLSEANVNRADAMLAGATTLFDWSEDSGATIAGKIVLGGVLMATMTWGSPVAAYTASAIVTVSSLLLLGHGAYTGLQAIAAEQQSTNGVEEYLAMRGQGQAVAEIGTAALGVYGGYRGMVKNPIVKPANPFTVAARSSAAPTLAESAELSTGLIVRNNPTAPTFSIYVSSWISRANSSGPLEMFIDARTGLLMVLQVGKSLFAEYVPVNTALAAEFLQALRTRQLVFPTGQNVSLIDLEAALCRILEQPLPNRTPVVPSIAPTHAASGY